MVIKDFWATVYRNVNDSNLRNDTIDVFQKDCYLKRNNVVCSGNFFLTFLSCIIFGFCVYRFVGFYKSHNYLYHAYIIYFTAALEVFLLAVKWIGFVWMYQIEFLASIMKMFQFVTLCHFQWSLVLNPRKIQRLLRPLLGLFTCFCTLIAILAIYLNFSPWIQCLIPHWLIISVSEVVCIQSYVLAGIFVTQMINLMENEDIKQKQKLHMWSVISVYEVSCCLTLIYYSVLQKRGDEKIGCSGVFFHLPGVFTGFYVPVMIIRYLLPISVTIFVMKPSSGYLDFETSFGRSNLLQPLIPSTNTSNEESCPYPACENVFNYFFWGSFEERNIPDPNSPQSYGSTGVAASAVVVGQPQLDRTISQPGNSNTLIINESSGENLSCSI